MEVEASSPLQPPAFRHPAHFGTDSPSRSYSTDTPIFGPALNCRRSSKSNHRDSDSRMQSSPTTDLAVDLSQNFHIDKTPVVPTPRRSLFSSLNARSLATTPPIPTSSPGNDMTFSPLPHKAPFSHSQTPSTPTDFKIANRGLCSSPPTESPFTDVPVRRPNLVERRISRPSLLRGASRLSGNSVSFKSQASSPIGFSKGPQIKLEELFGGSSPEQKKTGGLLTAPPGKVLAMDGSPIAPVNRPSRGGIQKPRGKVRRTLSMFENVEEVLHSAANEEDTKFNPGPSPTTLDPSEDSFIPSFTVKDDPLRRINRATLIAVLDGQYKEHYDEHIIVDCRFEYEYEGGHIAGAININSIDVLEETFFGQAEDKRRLIIFHCEYSAHRAPRMALHLRKRDRFLNMHRYPALNYPDIFILEGGYSSFFNQHKGRCEPQHYVEMDDEKHKRTCEREMSRFRRHTKFSRTQSFTYGASPGIDVSPSAGIASKRSSCFDFNLGPGKTRRTTSY
ncbi:Rhodanese-like domain-containing protein [Sphaerosporella brunnea]|uniref:M-phase inducer phosphatase n=1 Tax=Sphaerosporella brunnea TaxID=1250544 RepID=A0A5J5EQ10_9PEZI|nr:Rhodanese-like domain-containing protein [Sphaerosporella brunnea]